jgi:hypothetical protein
MRPFHCVVLACIVLAGVFVTVLMRWSSTAVEADGGGPSYWQSPQLNEGADDSGYFGLPANLFRALADAAAPSFALHYSQRRYNFYTSAATPAITRKRIVRAHEAEPVEPVWRDADARLTDPDTDEKTLRARARHMQAFTPSTDCPDQERVGGFGPGAKWVCQPRQLLRPGHCVVYSFGSNLDIGFELHLQLMVAGQDRILGLGSDRMCEIHVFDPTPSVVRAARGFVWPPNTHFHPWGLGAPGITALVLEGQNITELYTLDDVMARLEHTHIDVLKIDIEGSEFDMLNHPSVGQTTSAWRMKRIGQLQMEIHLMYLSGNQTDPQGSTDLTQMMQVLEHEMGMRLFRTEINEYNLVCWEFAFLQPAYVAPGGDGKALGEKLAAQPYSAELRRTARQEAMALREAHMYRNFTMSVEDSDSYDYISFMTWLQDGVVTCQRSVLLGDVRYASRFWCDAWRGAGESLRVLSVMDNMYSLAEPSAPGTAPLAVNEDVMETLLERRLSMQRDLVAWLPELAVVDVVSAAWLSAVSGTAAAAYLMSNARLPYHALHLALDGRDVLRGFLSVVLSLAVRQKLQLIIIDIHACPNCGSESTKVTEFLFTLAELGKIMESQGFYCYRKEARLGDMHVDRLSDLTHYALSFMRIEE